MRQDYRQKQMISTIYSVFNYLPMLMVSPKVMTERMTETTVAMGLNMETRTGPLFFIAHALKLTQSPPKEPPCATNGLRVR